MRRHSLVIDCSIIASLVVLNLLVIAPFLAMDFSSQPWNNDYTYIGMSRMFRDRPWTWNSLQYGGAPFHYLVSAAVPRPGHVASRRFTGPRLSLGQRSRLCAGARRVLHRRVSAFPLAMAGGGAGAGPKFLPYGALLPASGFQRIRGKLSPRPLEFRRV